jgi:hypothetical protein
MLSVHFNFFRGKLQRFNQKFQVLWRVWISIIFHDFEAQLKRKCQFVLSHDSWEIWSSFKTNYKTYIKFSYSSINITGKHSLRAPSQSRLAASETGFVLFSMRSSIQMFLRNFRVRSCRWHVIFSDPITWDKMKPISHNWLQIAENLMEHIYQYSEKLTLFKPLFVAQVIFHFPKTSLNHFQLWSIPALLIPSCSLYHFHLKLYHHNLELSWNKLELYTSLYKKSTNVTAVIFHEDCLRFETLPKSFLIMRYVQQPSLGYL